VVDLLLTLFDLIGTFAFAVSGAIAGVRHRLDIFGVLVLSFTAATFGGITRDVLIGSLPPASIHDWRYVAVSALAGTTVFLWHSKVSRVQHAVLLFDAAGLGLFAVAGAGKALAYHLGPIPAALLGMLTGIGGGVVRDVLVSEVPAVLRTDIYAVAALAGASVVVVGNLLQLPAQPVAIGGAILIAANAVDVGYWGYAVDALIFGGIFLAAGWGTLLRRGEAEFWPLIGGLVLTAAGVASTVFLLNDDEFSLFLAVMIGNLGLAACAMMHLEALELEGMDGTRLAAMLAAAGFVVAIISSSRQFPEAFTVLGLWVGTIGTIVFGGALAVSAGMRGLERA